jgi:hypothetical protein
MAGSLPQTVHAADPGAPAVDIDRASRLCLSPLPGSPAGLFGPGAARAALRALARPLLAGEAAAVLDGGHLFDPYAVSREERALGGSGTAALSRVRISRAFTCHQMEALLSRRLAPALERNGARLAVVFGLADLFADPDVPYAEACRLFRRCVLALRRAAAGGTRVVLVGENAFGPPGAARLPGTASSAGAPSRAGFFRYLVRTADPLLLLHEDAGGTRGVFRRSNALRKT